MIVGCQSYQNSWKLQSGHSDNQVSPDIRILFGSKHFCWHLKNFMILRLDEISYRFLIGIPFREKEITPVVDKILGLKNWGTRVSLNCNGFNIKIMGIPKQPAGFEKKILTFHFTMIMSKPLRSE